MTDKEKESLQRWLQAYWKDAIYAKKNAMKLQTFEAEKDFVWMYGLAAGFRLCCYSVLGSSGAVRLLDAMKEVDGWTKEVEEKYGMVL